MKLNFPIVLDGATGSELMKRGLPEGVCPEKWVSENPDALTSLQQEYEAAGSRLVLAPTFGAMAHKLAHYGLEREEDSLNRTLVALSKASVSENVLVAADVSPSGLFIAPYGDETMQSLIEKYSAQLSPQAEADVVVSETNMSVSDARAAVLAAKKLFDKPIFVTFTVDASGRTMMGANARSLLVIFRSLGVSAFGFNCGAGPKEMLGVVESLSDIRGDMPIIAKPNAGLPKMEDGRETYSMTPDELASYAERFAKAGVRAFGGCCGTSPEHIRALSAAVGTISWGFENPVCGEYLATEREIIAVGEANLSSEISCSEFLSDDLMDCVDTCPLIRVSSKSDIPLIEENQHAASLPICFACDDADLLSLALTSYNGRAGVVTSSSDARQIAEAFGAYVF